MISRNTLHILSTYIFHNECTYGVRVIRSSHTILDMRSTVYYVHKIYEMHNSDDVITQKIIDRIFLSINFSVQDNNIIMTKQVDLAI